MIGRLRGRHNFEQLARHGQRIARPPLWCSWCPSTDGPNVGFALTRALGPAVTRNLLRRRLRAIVRASDLNEPLPSVNVLIGARPAVTELTYDQLAVNTEYLLTKIRQQASSPQLSE